MADTKTAVIIGVGEAAGLGATLCRKAAGEGLHVFVAGRTEARLNAVVKSISKAGGAATAVITDTTDEASVDALIAKAEATGPVDLAIYNAGNNMPQDYLTMTAAFFEDFWRVCCFGGFLFSRAALRVMAKRGTGTLVFTGASASWRGKPMFAAFSSAKAGLRMIAQSLSREFGPKGIHVAHVVVDGGIDGARLKNAWPDYVEKIRAAGRLINLDGIADAYMFLYRQSSGAWTHELDLRTASEPW